ncbi:MAG: tetratricopeptide repeat protein [Elusimicrobiota bacterium]
MIDTLAGRLADRLKLGRFSRRLAAGSCVLAAVVFAASKRWTEGFGAAAPDWNSNVGGYVVPGESLIHGVPAGNVSFHLPLSSVAAALIYGHWSPSASASKILAAALTLALLIAVGGLLDVGWAGVAAVLVLWSLFPAYGGLGDYPQWLFSVLILLIAGTMTQRARKTSDRNTLMLALAVGISLLFRSTLVFLAPALILFEFGSGRAPRARLRQALILLAVPVLFLIPWMRMNWLLNRRIVVFEDQQASCNIVTGALGVVSTLDGPWRALVPKSVANSNGGLVLWAVSEILRHPARYALSCVERVLLAAGQWQFPLSFLAAAALFIGRRRPEIRALALLSAYFVGIHCLMPVQRDYFDPLRYLLILAASTFFSASSPRSAESAPARRARGVVVGALGAMLLLALYAESKVWNYASIVQGESLPGLLDRELSLHPRDAWLRLADGQRNLESGKFSEAVDSFQRAARLQPQNSRAAFLAAKAAFFSDRRNLGFRREDIRWTADPEYFLLNADADLASGLASRAAADLNAAHAAAVVRIGSHDSGLNSRDEAMIKRLRADELTPWIATLDPVMRDWPAADRHRVETLLAKLDLGGGFDAQLLKAKLLGEKGETLAAANLLEEAARRPLTLEDRRGLMEFAPTLGAGRETLALIGAAALGAPADAALLLDEAAALADLGRADSAASALEEAARCPLDGEERRRLIDLDVRLGRYEDALSRMEAIQNEAPPDASLLLEKAGALAELGRERDAAAALTEAARRRLTPDERRRAVDLDVRLRRFDEALALIDAIARERSVDPDLWLDKAGVFLALGREDSALTALAEAARGPLNRDRQRRIVSLDVRLRRDADALRRIDALSRDRPADLDLLLDTARALAHAGRRRAAEAALAEAARPALPPSRRFALALAHEELKDFTGARKIFRSLADEHPKDPSYANALGVDEYLAGDPAAAIRPLRAALAADPSYAPAALSLGAIYAQRGLVADAETLYEKTLAASRDDGADGPRRRVEEALRELKTASAAGRKE